MDGHDVVLKRDVDRLAGVPGVALMFEYRVRDEHRKRLCEHRGCTETGDSLSGLAPTDGVYGPSFPEWGNETHDKQDTKQSVTAVEHRRIPGMQRDQQQK